jgi:pyruvate ferredoxin oxidoreductase beta subunit/2-oxoisovalerate ferredoxin oxidoreductase beta subunit
MAAHRVPYAASISLAHPEDADRKLRHALETRGFRFLHVLSPCPTGWKSEPAEGIELIRLAVRSGLYPVLEVFGGRRFVVNVEPRFDADSLERYFKAQGRYRGTKEELAAVRDAVAIQWHELRRRSEGVAP